jgi:hypothetical protein
MPDPVLTHQQKVLRLYRKSLRLLFSWCYRRDSFNEEALKIRELFDDNKNIEAGMYLECAAVDMGDDFRIEIGPQGCISGCCRDKSFVQLLQK